MSLLKEISIVMDAPNFGKTMKCTAFEEKNGAIELAKTPKTRPRKKHIAIKHHHFRKHISNVDMIIEKVDTAEQEADFLTKPLVEQLFRCISKKVMGW